MRSHWVFCVFLLSSPLGPQKFPLHEFNVQGADRWPAGAVIAESGLSVGDMVEQADFEAAVERLHRTGFFRSARFSYKPRTVSNKPGFSLLFEIKEVSKLIPAIVDVPALGPGDVWEDLKSVAPFAGAQIPDNEDAEAYLRSALEDLLESRTGT